MNIVFVILAVLFAILTAVLLLTGDRSKGERLFIAVVGAIVVAYDIAHAFSL